MYSTQVVSSRQRAGASHRLGLRGIRDHVNEGEDKAAHAREDLQQASGGECATQTRISPGLRWAPAPSD